MRLSILLCAIAFAIACESGKSSAPPPGRVVAVRAKAEKGESLEGFCDVILDNSSRRRLELPEVDVGSISKAPPLTRWINVWATWCKPCIAEMPMLVQWKELLAKAGVHVALDFLSVDETAAIVDAFRKEHPEIPKSLHLKDHESLEPWMAELGLDKGAGLPIHIFVDSSGFIRCVRAAALSEGHYTTIVKLLR